MRDVKRDIQLVDLDQIEEGKLWNWITHLSGTSERSVDLSSLEGDGQVNGLVLQEGEADLILRVS